MQAHARARARTREHSRTHAHKHARTHARTHTVRTHAHTRTHARACAHTLGISLLLLGWQRIRTNPSSFLALRSAPCASSSRTIPYRPAHAAVCRAVPLQRSTPCCNTSAACYVRSAPTRRRHVQSRARAGRATCFALTIPRAARVHSVMAVISPTAWCRSCCSESLCRTRIRCAMAWRPTRGRPWRSRRRRA